MTCLGKDEPIRQPLVIALAMIMRDEIPNGGPQRFLSEQDHSGVDGELQNWPKATWGTVE